MVLGESTGNSNRPCVPKEKDFGNLFLPGRLARSGGVYRPCIEQHGLLVDESRAYMSRLKAARGAPIASKISAKRS